MFKQVRAWKIMFCSGLSEKYVFLKMYMNKRETSLAAKLKLLYQKNNIYTREEIRQTKVSEKPHDFRFQVIQEIFSKRKPNIVTTVL